MSKLPKLVVEAADLDVIRYLYSRGDNLLILEGQVVNSYEDFVKLCFSEPYKDKASLTVQIIQVVDGG